MTYGERIRSIRKKLGFTLDSFGEKLGVSGAAISAVEIGTRNLTSQMAKSICREYNVSYDYLMYGTGKMFDDLPDTILDELCAQYELDNLDRILIQEYLKLSPEERQVLKNFTKNIVVKFADGKKK